MLSILNERSLGRDVTIASIAVSSGSRFTTARTRLVAGVISPSEASVIIPTAVLPRIRRPCSIIVSVSRPSSIAILVSITVAVSVAISVSEVSSTSAVIVVVPSVYRAISSAVTITATISCAASFPISVAITVSGLLVDDVVRIKTSWTPMLLVASSHIRAARARQPPVIAETIAIPSLVIFARAT